MSERSCGPSVGVSTNAEMIDGDLERFAEELRLVAASGADYAEIILHSLDLVVDGHLVERRLDEVKRILSTFSLGYTLHLPFILNLLDHERLGVYLAVFRSGLRFASEIRCPTVVYHASAATITPAILASYYEPRYGTRDPARLRDVLFEEDAERLALLADEAASLGVKIGVENPIRYDLADVLSYGYEAEALAAQARRVGSPALGVTLDFGHLFLASRTFGFDYLEAVRTLAPLAVHAHVHDNFGRPDSGEPYMQRLPYGLGDLHLPPGEGLVPFDKALPILLGADFKGVLMLEIEFRFWPYFPREVARFRERMAVAERVAGIYH
jgi:sugar phosphate isomerase/epimerase